MKQDDYNTNDLWKLLFSLINFLVVIIILGFGYLVLQDPIKSFMTKPKFSHEQLMAYTKVRELARVEERNNNWDLVENGIHIKTGLKDDPNLKTIIGTCTSCHSAKLITQNRATREGWKNMIVWMQETQGLPDLGQNEPIVLDYLAKHYAPLEVGRRKNLDMAAIEWYVLKLETE